MLDTKLKVMIECSVDVSYLKYSKRILPTGYSIKLSSDYKFAFGHLTNLAHVD